MTPYEQNLYNQMTKLATKANMRILRLEKETGLKNSFGVKHLTDILSSEKLNVVTKKGRIGRRKNLSIEQMKAVTQHLRNFMQPDSISTVRQARQYKKQFMKKSGLKNISYKQINVEYQAKKESRNNIEHVDSDFWTISRLAKEQAWNEEKWFDEIKNYLDTSFVDESNKEELSNLYEYAMGVKL